MINYQFWFWKIFFFFFCINLLVLVITGSRSSKSIVDENLNVLKGRVEEIKVKEKLERCCKSDIYGWNHVAITNYETKYGSIIKRSESRSNQHPLMELLELAAIIGGTLGLTFFSGTFFLCLVSLFVHLNWSFERFMMRRTYKVMIKPIFYFWYWLSFNWFVYLIVMYNKLNLLLKLLEPW